MTEIGFISLSLMRRNTLSQPPSKRAKSPEPKPKQSSSTPDRIMTLAEMAQKDPLCLIAGIGAPTGPLPKAFNDTKRIDHEENTKYSPPQGSLLARRLVADVLSRWYKLHNTAKLTADDILYTIGAAGALSVVFKALSPCIIVAVTPCHSLYHPETTNQGFVPINTLQLANNRLTANSLQKGLDDALQRAKINDKNIIFLLCDPHNPTGTVLTPDELHALAQVLRQDRYQDVIILLDEAYAELLLNGKKHTSLLEAAPDLIERIIVIRTATKGLGIPATRTGALACKNKELMKIIVAENMISVGQAAITHQVPYANALAECLDSEGEASEFLKRLAEHYTPKMDYVRERLLKTGATTNIKPPEGGFYETACLDELRYLLEHDSDVSDTQIAEALIMKYQIMVTPIDYFYPSNPRQKNDSTTKGWFRLTCTAPPEDLKKLMNRIANALIESRGYINRALTDTKDELIRKWPLLITNPFPEEKINEEKQLGEEEDVDFQAMTLKNNNDELIRWINAFLHQQAFSTKDQLPTHSDFPLTPKHFLKTYFPIILHSDRSSSILNTLTTAHHKPPSYSLRLRLMRRVNLFFSLPGSKGDDHPRQNRRYQSLQ